MATKQYYTAQEAMRKLGVSKTTFYEYVKDGRITKKLPSRKQRGAFFLARDVDDLASALRGFVKQYSETRETTVFRPARPEDAPGMFELGERIMSRSGGYGILLVRDEHIIGYFTILPLKHDTLLQIMRREIRAREVKPEELAKFEPGNPIDCFLWEVMSDPDQKHIGQYLIGKMLTFFHSLGKRGVDIQGIYATATSREGIDICHKMGMQQMNLPEVIQPNWIPFEWKIQEQKNWLTKNYIQALKSYKKRQQRMQQQADAPAAWTDPEE